MERIVTSVKKVSPDSKKYPNRNKERLLYEVNAIIDDNKKQFGMYGDTEAFLDVLDDLEKYLESCGENIEEEAIKYTEDNRFKYNLIGLPLYILSFFAVGLSVGMSEFIGFLSLGGGITIGVATYWLANKNIYYSKSLKEKKANLIEKEENLEKLKEKCQKLVETRNKKEQLREDREFAEKLEAKHVAWKMREKNIEELNQDLARRNLPPEESRKIPNMNHKKSKFQPDIPEFIRREMETRKKFEQFRNGEYNKEYDVLEQTGRKR